MFILILTLANAICMFVNLVMYAWGNHLPESLAIGILNGFVMLWINQK
jgi:hypothetical protein